MSLRLLCCRIRSIHLRPNIDGKEIIKMGIINTLSMSNIYCINYYKCHNYYKLLLLSQFYKLNSSNNTFVC